MLQGNTNYFYICGITTGQSIFVVVSGSYRVVFEIDMV